MHRNARSVALIVAATVVLLVFPIGCEGINLTFEGSPFSVGTESQALFDAGLVGVWRSMPTGGEEPTELTINSRDGRTYEIAMREGGDDTAFEMTGFVVEVGGVRVLNARAMKRQEPQVSGYVLFRYELEAPDGLVVTPLEDDGSDRSGVESADEFFRFLQVHIHESTLYGKSTHYRRVALWGAQPNNRLQATAGGSGGHLPARRALALCI